MPRWSGACSDRARPAERAAGLVECLRVRAFRERDDLSLRRRSFGDHRRVVLREVRQCFRLSRQVGQLAVLTERAGVGERDLEYRRQGPRGKLRRERRPRPLVLDGVDLDRRVRLLEFGDLCVELRDRRLGAPRDQRCDTDIDRLRRTLPCVLRRRARDRRDGQHGGHGDDHGCPSGLQRPSSVGLHRPFLSLTYPLA